MTPDHYLPDVDSDVRFRLEFAGRASIEQARSLRKLLYDLPPGTHAARCRLNSKLAGALSRNEPESAQQACADAVREAELAGDEISEAWALLAQCVVDLSPERTEFRLSAALRIRDIAKKSDAAGCFEPGYFILLGCLLELGQISELDQELSTHGPTLSYFPDLEHSRHVSWLRFVRSFVDGDSQKAEDYIREGYQRAISAEDYDADFVLTAQLSMLYHLHGQGEQMESCFLIGRQLLPEEAVWTCGLAWVWAKQGKMSAARGLVDAIGPVSAWPRGRNWLVAGCLLADTLALLHITDGAEDLYAELSPFAQRLANFGSGVALWAPVARSLGLLAQLLGREDEAIEHLRTSLAACARIGAQPWLVEAHLELSQALIEQDREANAAEITSLLREAEATADSLQLTAYKSMAAHLLQTLGAVSAPHESPGEDGTADKVTINVLGRFEVIAANGQPAIWHSKKARELLKLLISRRGTAMHKERVMSTLWPDQPLEKLVNRFAVAVSTVRRALDPDKQHPADHFLATDMDLVHLRLEHMVIDVEQFLNSASTALSARDNSEASLAALEHAVNLYTGEIFPEERSDVDWAESIKIETRTMFCAAAHAFAEQSEKKGNQHNRAESYRRILKVNRHDHRAHEKLIETYVALGALGMARAAKEEYRKALNELRRTRTNN